MTFVRGPVARQDKFQTRGGGKLSFGNPSPCLSLAVPTSVLIALHSAEYRESIAARVQRLYSLSQFVVFLSLLQITACRLFHLDAGRQASRMELSRVSFVHRFISITLPPGSLAELKVVGYTHRCQSLYDTLTLHVPWIHRFPTSVCRWNEVEDYFCQLLRTIRLLLKMLSDIG